MNALVLALLWLSPAARAQPQPSQPPTLEAREAQKDQEPLAVFSKAHQPKDEPTPLGQALTLAFPTTFFAEVKISTAGPVVELSRLNREGFYKLELIELLLMSRKAGKPLQAGVERRRKGDTLRAIAVSWGLDFDALYDAALAVEELVDRDYLPRYPQRPPRKERDE